MQIATGAKTDGAEIQWGDETEPRSDAVRGRGHVLKGHTSVMRVNSELDSVNRISTVTNQSKPLWKVFEGAMNTDILISFFKRLIKGAERMVLLILDNWRVCHAHKVKAGQVEHTERIEVYYLP